jgi:cytochrome c oxidase assembly protein subunit 15
MRIGRPIRPSPWLTAFATVTSVLLFVVLVAGFVVTDTGSGQGCGGSWPLCNGRFVPVFAVHALIEFSHRVLSALAGLFVFVLLIWVWRAIGPKRPDLFWSSAVGLLGVVAQGILGALNVLHPQSAAILAFHFGVSLVAFGGVFLANVLLVQLSHAPEDTGTLRASPVPRRLRTLTWALLLYTGAVVYVGAYLAHLGTGLACDGWPLCRGSLFPGFGGGYAVAFLHRLLVLVLLAFLAVYVRETRAVADTRPEIRRAAHAASALVLLQALSGGYLVASRLSLWASLIHVALMIVLFAALAYLVLQVSPEPQGAPKRSSAPLTP